MEPFSVCVTGANRGVGLGLVKHLVQLPSPPKFVFATYRSINGLEALSKISDSSKRCRVLLIKMDVTKNSDVQLAKKIIEDTVGARGLTLLINNAGVAAEQKFPQITEENLIYHFKTNTIGPIMVVQEFLPLLQKAAFHHGSVTKMSANKAAVLNISSIGGSSVYVEDYYSDINRTDIFSYNVSKAALNMAMRVIGAKLKPKEILVVMMCPGYVKTDMSSNRGELTVDQSVMAILQTLGKLNESHHSTFMDRNGNAYQF